MQALGKRTIQVGITLGAIVGLVGCAEMADDTDADILAATQSENGLSLNGLSLNGLSLNGLSLNGLSLNGLSLNGLSLNGLSTVDGLSSTTGLMTTPGGRDIVKYMVKCALPASDSLTKQDQNGVSYTFPGAIGVAPALKNGPCDVACQERVSACMLAHVNNSGMNIDIWLDSEGAIGWGTSPDFPYQEGSFFGNLFPNPWQGFYCNGKGYDAGSVPGRLGEPIASNVYVNPYGGNVECGSSGQCAGYGNDGYNSCNTSINGQFKTWSKVVTVWRNFDQNTAYKICNYGTGGKCLAIEGSSTADNAAVEEQTYSGGNHQKFWILKTTAGKYKVVNINSGKAVDVSGSAMVQKTYTGTASQQTAFNSLGSTGQSGRYTLIPSSGSAGFTFSSGNDGTNGSTTTNLSMDTAKWTVTPIGAMASPEGGSPPPPPPPPAGMFDPSRTYRLVPQHATGSSVDVAYNSTNNGTLVQQWQSHSGDGQQFFLLASGSNWKIAMKANQNKCLGPAGNGTGNGTMMEVQDCNGSNNQAFIVTVPSTGVYTFKNVAANRCVDVVGPSTANGTRIHLWDCNNQNNQKFAAQ